MTCAVIWTISAIAHSPSTIAREATSPPCPGAPPDKLLSMAACVVRNDVAMSMTSFSVSVARRPFQWTAILTGLLPLSRMSAIANCIWVCRGRRARCSSTRRAPICCVTLRMRVGTLTEFLVQYERSRFCLNVRTPVTGSSSAALASLTSCSFAGSSRSLSALTTARVTYESSRLCLNVSAPSAGSSPRARFISLFSTVCVVSSHYVSRTHCRSPAVPLARALA